MSARTLNLYFGTSKDAVAITDKQIHFANIPKQNSEEINLIALALNNFRV